MTLDIPSPTRLALERQAVLDDLGLAMLFVDCGSIALDPEPPPHAEPASGFRVLRASVVPHVRSSPAATAAVLCRVLHNLRVPAIEIMRIDEGLLMRCRYRLPSGAWTVELRIPATPVTSPI